MSVIKSVRRHIGFLHTDTIIFTKDFLQHGTRVSVDMCLHRLALSGFLRRLSFGMYVRNDCTRTFTPAEIADAKKIWLIQRKLQKLTTSSPGLILSCTQKHQLENFAPPAVLITNLTRPMPLVASSLPSTSPLPR